MSTRSAIIMKTETGYAGIYCHFDGYCTGVGAVLNEYYQDSDKVARLIALGDISHIEINVEPTGPHSFDKPQKDVTVAYGRDRGETGTQATVGKTAKAVAAKIGHNGYVYVFENGDWTCNGKPLVQMIKKEQRAA
jgi:hypothetical protein